MAWKRDAVCQREAIVSSTNCLSGKVAGGQGPVPVFVTNTGLEIANCRLEEKAQATPVFQSSIVNRQFFGGGGQPDAKDGSISSGTFHVDLSSVLVDDLLHHRQPEPDTVVLARG